MGFQTTSRGVFRQEAKLNNLFVGIVVYPLWTVTQATGG